MRCQRCQSKRVADVNGKTADLCGISLGEHESFGYVPLDLGLGGGDYLRFRYCLDCGQLQGMFPLPRSAL